MCAVCVFLLCREFERYRGVSARVLWMRRVCATLYTVAKDQLIRFHFSHWDMRLSRSEMFWIVFAFNIYLNAIHANGHGQNWTRSTSTFQRGDKMRTRFWNRNTYALRIAHTQNQLKGTTSAWGRKRATIKWFFADSISFICPKFMWIRASVRGIHLQWTANHSKPAKTKNEIKSSAHFYLHWPLATLASTFHPAFSNQHEPSDMTWQVTS